MTSRGEGVPVGDVVQGSLRRPNPRAPKVCVTCGAVLSTERCRLCGLPHGFGRFLAYDPAFPLGHGPLRFVHGDCLDALEEER